MEGVEQGPVQGKQIEERAAESPPHVAFRDAMPAALDAVADTKQGEVGAGNPQIEQVQPKACFPNSAQHGHIRAT